MYQQPMSRRMSALVKAGVRGICSIVLLFFSIVFFVAGIGLVASSYDSSFQSDFFESSNRGTRVAGFILLTVAFILFVIDIALCCFVCKTMSANNSQTGTVLRPGPVVSGVSVQSGRAQPYTPQPAYAPHPQQPAYPPQQPAYPPQQPAYAPPSQQPAYAPPPQQPAYAPPPQQPAYASPPQQPAYAPPPVETNPNYPFTLGAGYQPPGGYAPKSYEPPPSYNEVSAELPVKRTLN